MAAAVPAAIIGVSAVVQAIGSIKQGQSAKAIGEENSKLSEYNAGIVRAQTDEEARRYRIFGSKYVGQQISNVGASGVQMSGSAKDVLKESEANIESNILDIYNQGAAKIEGLNRQATIYRKGGQSALNNSYLSAAGELLRGAGTIAYGERAR